MAAEKEAMERIHTDVPVVFHANSSHTLHGTGAPNPYLDYSISRVYTFVKYFI